MTIVVSLYYRVYKSFYSRPHTNKTEKTQKINGNQLTIKKKIVLDWYVLNWNFVPIVRNAR